MGCCTIITQGSLDDDFGAKKLAEQPKMRMCVASSFLSVVICAWPALTTAATTPKGLILGVDGRYSPAAGYTWVSAAAGDLRIKWNAGSVHPQHPHVIASSSENAWTPALGYVWVSPASDDFSVKWNAGSPHPKHPNVVASSDAGYWVPATGYAWKTTSPTDYSVVSTTDSERLERVAATVLFAALAHQVSQPQHDDGFFETIGRVVARGGRDLLVESAIVEAIPNLDSSHAASARRLICLWLDDRLDNQNWTHATRREQIIAQLRRDNPAAAQSVVLVDLIQRVIEMRSRTP